MAKAATLRLGSLGTTVEDPMTYFSSRAMSAQEDLAPVDHSAPVTGADRQVYQGAGRVYLAASL